MAGRPKGTGGKALEISSTQIRRIVKVLTGTTHELRDRALFYLGLGSGLRISEIVGLRIGVVMSNGKVVKRVVMQKHATKSKRSRTVYLSKQAVEHLQTYLDTRAPLDDPQEPVFPSQMRPNEPMTSANGIRLLKRMFDEAGVKNASSHSLRRTHANTLRRVGTDLKIIQEQLGHASLAVTERYFEVDPLERQQAVEQLRF